MKWFNEAVRGNGSSDVVTDLEGMYLQILNNLPDKIIKTDMDRRVQWVNQTIVDHQAKMDNQPAAIGRFCHDVLYGSSAPCEGCPREKAVTSKKVEHANVRYKMGHDTLVNHVTAVPLFNEHKNMIGMIEICRDITDQENQKKALERQKNELEDAKRSAEAANKEKSRFINNICHEIRTPLNGVMGMTQLLRVTELNDNQMEYVTLLNQSSIRLMQTVEAISEISKHEEIREKPSISVFSLDGLLDELSALFSLKADTNHLGLQFFYDSEIPKKLKGDAYRIYQAISNILDNAIKYTAQGKVLVSSHLVERTDTTVRLVIMIKDTGRGIPQEKIEHVFERFKSYEDQSGGELAGDGLGLAVTRHLMEVLGGSIEIDSEIGEGTRVKLNLPLEYLPETTQTVETETIREVGHHESPPTSRRRILIAEDEVMNRLTFKMVLKDEYELLYAKNGKEALEMFFTEKPDLMILDIMMPVMDGFKVLDEIEKKGIHVPIIACTARVFDTEPTYLTGYGFADYLAKPIMVDQLRQMVRRLLNTNLQAK